MAELTRPDYQLLTLHRTTAPSLTVNPVYRHPEIENETANDNDQPMTRPYREFAIAQARACSASTCNSKYNEVWAELTQTCFQCFVESLSILVEIERIESLFYRIVSIFAGIDSYFEHFDRSFLLL